MSWARPMLDQGVMWPATLRRHWQTPRPNGSQGRSSRRDTGAICRCLVWWGRGRQQVMVQHDVWCGLLPLPLEEGAGSHRSRNGRGIKRPCLARRRRTWRLSCLRMYDLLPRGDRGKYDPQFPRIDAQPYWRSDAGLSRQGAARSSYAKCRRPPSPFQDRRARA